MVEDQVTIPVLFLQCHSGKEEVSVQDQITVVEILVPLEVQVVHHMSVKDLMLVRDPLIVSILGILNQAGKERVIGRITSWQMQRDGNKVIYFFNSAKEE